MLKRFISPYLLLVSALGGLAYLRLIENDSPLWSVFVKSKQYLSSGIFLNQDFTNFSEPGKPVFDPSWLFNLFFAVLTRLDPFEYIWVQWTFFLSVLAGIYFLCQQMKNESLKILAAGIVGGALWIFYPLSGTAFSMLFFAGHLLLENKKKMTFKSVQIALWALWYLFDFYSALFCGSFYICYLVFRDRRDFYKCAIPISLGIILAVFVHPSISYIKFEQFQWNIGFLLLLIFPIFVAIEQIKKNNFQNTTAINIACVPLFFGLICLLIFYDKGHTPGFGKNYMDLRFSSILQLYRTQILSKEMVFSNPEISEKVLIYNYRPKVYIHRNFGQFSKTIVRRYRHLTNDPKFFMRNYKKEGITIVITDLRRQNELTLARELMKSEQFGIIQALDDLLVFKVGVNDSLDVLENFKKERAKLKIFRPEIKRPQRWLSRLDQTEKYRNSLNWIKKAIVFEDWEGAFEESKKLVKKGEPSVLAYRCLIGRMLYTKGKLSAKQLVQVAKSSLMRSPHLSYCPLTEAIGLKGMNKPDLAAKILEKYKILDDYEALLFYADLRLKNFSPLGQWRINHYLSRARNLRPFEPEPINKLVEFFSMTKNDILMEKNMRLLYDLTLNEEIRVRLIAMNRSDRNLASPNYK